MKLIIKILFLFFISSLTLYFMYNNNIIDFSSLKTAFFENKSLLIFIAFLQILNCMCMTIRYFSLLKIFKIKTDFQNVTAATFVSNGVGQWLPGSMAFMEVIRIGLMIGAEKFVRSEENKNFSKLGKVPNNEALKTTMIESNLAQLSLKSKLAAVSIMDRLIGIAVMLFLGLIFLLLIFISLINSHEDISTNFLIFFVFSLVLFSSILLLPYISKAKLFRRFLSRIERLCLVVIKLKKVNFLIRKIFQEINSLLDAIALGSKKSKQLLLPVVFSLASFLVFVGAMYLSAKALSTPLPIHVIFAVLPFVAIASLIPMGLAGMGGMQLVAALLFSIFDISPNAASSAHLLQTAVNLVAISLMGLLFAKLSAKQIYAIINSKRNENLVHKENTSDISTS